MSFSTVKLRWNAKATGASELVRTAGSSSFRTSAIFVLVRAIRALALSLVVRVFDRGKPVGAVALKRITRHGYTNVSAWVAGASILPLSMQKGKCFDVHCPCDRSQYFRGSSSRVFVSHKQSVMSPVVPKHQILREEAISDSFQNGQSNIQIPCV